MAGLCCSHTKVSAERWGCPERGRRHGPARPNSTPVLGALDGGFRFSLSDGEHTSPGHFFRVVAQKQPLLSLEGSRTLTVCPGGCTTPGSYCLSSHCRPCPGSRAKADSPLLPLAGSVQPLSSQSLRASSSAGTDPRQLLYQVVQGPQLGRLFHTQRGPAGEALVNFTQAEVRTPLYSHHLDSSLE